MVTTFLLLAYFTHGFSGAGAEVSAQEFLSRRECEMHRQAFIRSSQESNAGGICVPVKRTRPRPG